MKRIIFAAIFIVPILSASKAPCPYSRYQIESWVLGGGEGFRDTWYPDGKTRSGIQKYSIGHGYNDWGTAIRRKQIEKYLSGGLTWEESMEISRGELAKCASGHFDMYTDLAFRLHTYNTGRCKRASDLGKCCGGREGCGSPLSNVRESHNLRRKLEVALANHNFDVANPIIEMYRDRKDREYRAYLKKSKPNKPKSSENEHKQGGKDVPVGWFDRIFSQ